MRRYNWRKRRMMPAELREWRDGRFRRAQERHEEQLAFWRLKLREERDRIHWLEVFAGMLIGTVIAGIIVTTIQAWTTGIPWN